ncbi:hypothetical protein BDZ97DRAFT_2074303 [Flammula alnicola]|nr:hypothetical protein BDZ97DRAFT_2074303 [Flammula alnicola]
MLLDLSISRGSLRRGTSSATLSIFWVSPLNRPLAAGNNGAATPTDGSGSGSSASAASSNSVASTSPNVKRDRTNERLSVPPTMKRDRTATYRPQGTLSPHRYSRTYLETAKSKAGQGLHLGGSGGGQPVMDGSQAGFGVDSMSSWGGDGERDEASIQHSPRLNQHPHPPTARSCWKWPALRASTHPPLSTCQPNVSPPIDAPFYFGSTVDTRRVMHGFGLVVGIRSGRRWLRNSHRCATAVDVVGEGREGQGVVDGLPGLAGNPDIALLSRAWFLSIEAGWCGFIRRHLGIEADTGSSTCVLVEGEPSTTPNSATDSSASSPSTSASLSPSASVTPSASSSAADSSTTPPPASFSSSALGGILNSVGNGASSNAGNDYPRLPSRVH